MTKQPILLNTYSSSQLTPILNNGGVGVLPTDTLYGLVCAASNNKAVAKLYNLKNRENKPGTIIAGSIDQLIELGIKRRYLTAVERFWPNPLSIIIPSIDLDYLHLGKQSLACRIISEPKELLNVLSKTGPLLTTSANLPGQAESNTITEAQAYFGDKVDFYVDGGDLSGQLPSTVIRVVDDAIEVLRNGAVNIDESGQISP